MLENKTARQSMRNVFFGRVSFFGDIIWIISRFVPQVGFEPTT